jgi:hypothetical protein
MDFALYLLLNAVLLLRPEDLIPAIAGVRLYYVTICGCLLAALPRLAARLRPAELADRPVAACVLGVLLAAVLTTLPRGGADAAQEIGSEFGKVVLFFLLTVAVVDTPERLRAVAGWLVLCLVGMAAMAVGTYFGWLDLEVFEPIPQWDVDPASGELVTIYRLVGSGVFADPNDMCLAMVLGGVCGVYRAVTAGGLFARAGWLLPVGFFFYTLTLTQSRGGVLAMLAATAAGLFARFGGRRAGMVALLAVPALLALVGGRGANIAGGGTAHERLMYWATGLGDLLARPAWLPLGLGVGYFQEECGQVAHNSFVSAYVETGLLGGGAFLLAFVTAARQAMAVGRDGPAEPWAATARPFVLALLAGYAVGCYSLTRMFVVPTYLVLGLAAAYAGMAEPVTPDRFRVTGRWLLRAAVVSAVGLAAVKLLTQALGMMGV